MKHPAMFHAGEQTFLDSGRIILQVSGEAKTIVQSRC